MPTQPPSSELDRCCDTRVESKTRRPSRPYSQSVFDFGEVARHASRRWVRVTEDLQLPIGFASFPCSPVRRSKGDERGKRCRHPHPTRFEWPSDRRMEPSLRRKDRAVVAAAGVVAAARPALPNNSAIPTPTWPPYLKAPISSLGCGNPQAIAGLRPGERVLDLGSGAGFDAFLAAQQVGPTGQADSKHHFLCHWCTRDGVRRGLAPRRAINPAGRSRSRVAGTWRTWCRVGRSLPVEDG